MVCNIMVLDPFYNECRGYPPQMKFHMILAIVLSHFEKTHDQVKLPLFSCDDKP